MALTYPLARDQFADLLEIESGPFEIATFQEMSGLGSGQPIFSEMFAPVWRAHVRTAPMLNSRAKHLRALADAMVHENGSFAMYDHLACYPRRDPGGERLGSRTVTVLSIGSDRKSLRLSGLPTSYQLSIGDRVSFLREVGSIWRRSYHELVEGITSSSLGTTGTFQVHPHLPAWLVTGLEATLRRPAARMVIVPGSFRATPSVNRSVVEFDAMQVRN